MSVYITCQSFWENTTCICRMDVFSVDGIHVSTIFAWLLYSGTSLCYDYRRQSLNVYIPFGHAHYKFL